MSEETHLSGKIILIGSSGVGKTCLANAYLIGEFTKEALSSVAPSSWSTTMEVKGNVIDLAIWDTAGQEQFYSISQMFFRDSDIAFICFTQDTMETIDTWAQRINQESPKCIIFLVVTKCDLIDSDTKNQLHNDLEPIQERIGAKGIFFTSAQSKVGVKELFQAAGARAVDLALEQQNLQPKGVKLDEKKETEQKKSCSC